MTNFITLNNGYQIPQLGFGTIQQFGKQIEDNVAFALNHGYQLIDTANRYGNEVEVGKGLKLSGLKREYYFLETKLGPTLYENDQAIDWAWGRPNLNERRRTGCVEWKRTVKTASEGIWK